MDKHEMIYRELLRRIESGSFKENDQLPTEAELCRTYGVSRITAMRAVKDLQSAGLVRRVSGRGTFVCRSSRQALRPFHLVIPMLNTRYYTQMAQAFGKFFAQRQCPFCISLTEYDLEFTASLLNSIAASGSRGLAIIPQGIPANDQILAGYLNAFPYSGMAVSRALSGFVGPQIAVDEEEGGGIAARHLLERGHRRFLYVGPNGEVTRTSVLRYCGVVQALRTAGLPPEALTTLDSVDSIAMLRIREIFSAPDAPTAVIAADENLAATIYDTLKVFGRQIGPDVAIVGLDGGLIGLSLETPLTAVEFPGAEIGLRAAETLFAIDTGADTGNLRRLIRVAPRLVIRASCGEGGQVYRHEYLRELLREKI